MELHWEIKHVFSCMQARSSTGRLTLSPFSLQNEEAVPRVPPGLC